MCFRQSPTGFIGAIKWLWWAAWEVGYSNPAHVGIPLQRISLSGCEASHIQSSSRSHPFLEQRFKKVWTLWMPSVLISHHWDLKFWPWTRQTYWCVCALFGWTNPPSQTLAHIGVILSFRHLPLCSLSPCDSAMVWYNRPPATAQLPNNRQLPLRKC